MTHDHHSSDTESNSHDSSEDHPTPLTPSTDHDENFRCGFVTLIGAPNVGKSTLLNALIGEHLAITSKRPQTTRNRIPGVFTREDA
jgi:GTP-binding protein Era